MRPPALFAESAFVGNEGAFVASGVLCADMLSTGTGQGRRQVTNTLHAAHRPMADRRDLVNDQEYQPPRKNSPHTMETKYRTLIQAAVMLLVLAVIVLNHSSDKAEQAVAQKTVQTRR